YPTPGHADHIPVIEEWRDVVFEDVIERGRVECVLYLWVFVQSFAPNRPPQPRARAFPPPTIPDADVEGAVRYRLHPAGTARFEWPKRRIQPGIAALDKRTCEVHIVPFEQHDAAAEFGPPAVLEHLADQLLCLLIPRVRFAGED